MKIIKYIFGGLIGGVLGFGFYFFIGCKSGTCPIQSNPFASTIFGIIFGVLIIDSIKDFSKRSANKTVEK